MKLQKLAGLISMNIIAKNGNTPLPKTATPYCQKRQHPIKTKPLSKKITLSKKIIAIVITCMLQRQETSTQALGELL